MNKHRDPMQQKATEEEESRLMDLVQDDLNFKRNLVQKNIFRMANNPDRMVVEFRNLKAKKDVFFLEFGKHDPYNVVVGRVAQKLCVKLKIRLTRHNCFLNEPNSDPIEFLFHGCLLDMVIIPGKICNVLYYEVLDDPEVDLECSKKLDVSYGYPYEKISVVLSRHSRVADLLNNIKLNVVKLANSIAELRLLGIYNYKIYKFFHVDEKIEDIPEEANLRIEEVLVEKHLGGGNHLISVYHFTKLGNGVIVRFGEPFLFVIRDDETLAKVKVRIQEKLSVGNEEFSKWKFTLLCLGRLQYLEDSDVVYNCFEGKNEVLELYLGLEHRIEYEEDDGLDDFSDSEDGSAG